NSEWNEPRTRCGATGDDGDNGQGDNRLSRPQEEAYLVAIVRTFLDAALGQSPSARDALAGQATILGQEAITARASFAESVEMLPLVEQPARSGFTVFGKYPFTQSADAYNASFFHATSGYVGVWQEADPSFFLPIPNASANPRFVA